MRNQIPGKDKKPEERKSKENRKRRKFDSFSAFPSANMQVRAMLNCHLKPSMHGHGLMLV